MSPEIILIAALSSNRVIGIDNHLPWELHADWENFKEVTHGFPFIMGRKSYESPDMLYSGVENVVLTSNIKYTVPEKFVVAQDLQEALSKLKNYSRIFVLGGERVFRESLPLATHLYLTEVQAEVQGDARFPEINFENWILMKSVFYSPDERHEYGFYMNEYERKRSE